MAKDFLSASNFVVTIDKKALLNSITTGSNGKITGTQVRQYILPITEEARADLIKDFYNHSITKELQAGPKASNSSGTLGGYGNLFSYIGFDSGDNPTQIIEEIIKQRLNVRVRAIGRGRFRITIDNVVSKEDIFAVTPIPWADGASWAESMEKGMSNLGSFLYKSSGLPESNSGTGLQVSRQLRSTTFKTQPYISKILQDFRKNLIKF